MAMSLLSFFIFTFFSISAAVSSGSLPQPAPKSLTIGYIQKAGDCNYRVNITTSCSSPFHITAEIGVLFGDAHGNQIYEPKLEVESSKAFAKCSKDIFELTGPCTDQICFFYLYKNGSDDWIPETVEISSPDIDTVKYKYNSSIPDDTWDGFDDCQYFTSPPPPPPSPPAPSTAGHLRRLKGLAYVIPVLLSSAVL
ncbi:embryo-specific protein ATS3B-like [Cucurbita pepo subsp. pepo]|uniref:embryo-specific protein ATS3B-like n=1 Tax=Cucurbita pepo subsp. pepo TaxID=3664 RepID=UPI000C9D5262|nr:embryo-specific protein ATS3B-like [Cucurbita pepo subsp. pepo]